ncbi:hypothetical protein B0H19DRAFT_1258906 [Mycena capillaripes]|nr:hypothetical protein B0H19DRAFT_1258906 [Mycena capillaripes]
MDSDTLHPHFPPELEREIFETAADLHPETIPNLLLVAARVLGWIEPLKYRTFIFAGSPSSCRRLQVLKRAILLKSAQFIHDNVWHLFAGPDFVEASLDDVLPCCTGLTSLVLFRTHITMLSRLHARPRRLAMPLESFDFTLPMFAALTHLNAFELMDITSWTSNWKSLGLLPMLTHLAFPALQDPTLWPRYS